MEASATGEAANIEVAFLLGLTGQQAPGPLRSRAGTQAARQVASQAPGWWLHIDLDVLAGDEFSACGAAHDPAMPGGLSWTELTVVVSSALRAGGCRGWSLGVYNPDLDPERHAARQIVNFLAETTGSWPQA